jgi:hypothetical protein
MARLGNICLGKDLAYLSSSSSDTRPIASMSLVLRSRPVTCLSGVRVEKVRCSKFRDSTELNGVWGSKTVVDVMPVTKVGIRDLGNWCNG